MADLLELQQILAPITALEFFQLGRLYLLAGEGRTLRIFEHATGELLHAQNIFHSQVIHGIVCWGVACIVGCSDSTGRVLLWGEQALSVFDIMFSHESTGSVKVEFLPVYSNDGLHDRILHGCFYAQHIDETIKGSMKTDALLVNAHNELISLDLEYLHADNHPDAVHTVASGPRSMLYSAHLTATATGRVLIAAGTFFGEIVLWSYRPGASTDPAYATHYIFRGHEGSVFGVQISEKVENGAVERILASCSDDRTIRIWNISDTSNYLTPEEIQPSSETGFGTECSQTDSVYCLATASGHASRIWGLRFLTQKDGSWGLISYGEDSTAWTWLLSPEPTCKTSLSAVGRSQYALRHQNTYTYHSGKNILAVTVHSESVDRCLVSTGGADGRITSYHPKIDGLCLRPDFSLYNFKFGEVYRLLSPDWLILKDPHTRTSRNGSEFGIAEAFSSLGGQWTLKRTISDGRTYDPPGTLEGTATFIPRDATDEFYDAEYLYTENGEFTTAKGLKLRAHRQYVWRYCRGTKEITVWFVKIDDNYSVDYLFHKLEFHVPDHQGLERPQSDSTFELAAGGYHLCDQDTYDVEYTFQEENLCLKQWTLKYTVLGPKKDYVSASTYTRDSEPNGSNRSECGLIGAYKPNSLLHFSNIENQYQISESEVFKTYAWLTEYELLASTDQGNFLLATFNNVERKGEENLRFVSWGFVGRQKELASVCIATSIVGLGCAFLTGSEGTIYLYSNSTKSLSVIDKLPRKATYLKAQSFQINWTKGRTLDNSSSLDYPRLQINCSHSLQEHPIDKISMGVVAKCIGLPKVFVLFYQFAQEWSKVGLTEIQFDPQETFIITSSCFVDHEKNDIGGFLILGSRSGQLAVCDLSVSSSWPMIFHMHKDAITSIVLLPRVSSGGEGSKTTFVTTGRDGTYKVHEMALDLSEEEGNGRPNPDVKTVHDCRLPFGPYIEGACFNARTQELFVWGFRSKRFVVWNEYAKAEVLSVECGNGHRKWDFLAHGSGMGGASFVWTQASACYLYLQEDASHRILQHGGHGREIKAMAVVPFTESNGSRWPGLLATGSEDTTIRIFGVDMTLKVPLLYCLSMIIDHTTGIQQLRWSEDGRHLFSAGGCEEFVIWRIASVPEFGLGVVQEARCPKCTESSSLRIMDFDVMSYPSPTEDTVVKTYFLILAYSDSSLRVFRYSPGLNNVINLESTGFYKTNCLTQVSNVRPNSGRTLQALHLCTVSTDGSLVLWVLDARPAPNPTFLFFQAHLHWNKVLKLHQNSVNCLDSSSFAEDGTVIVTGGDDGDINLIYLKFAELPTLAPIQSSKKIAHAHVTAVTAVKCINALEMGDGGGLIFASVGPDQNLQLRRAIIDPEAKDADDVREGQLEYHYTSVADASSIEVWEEKDGPLLFVGGVGIEIWRLRKKPPEGLRAAV